MNQVEDSNKLAEIYYDSTDADNFYYEIWGGKDIHVGWYTQENQPIFEASHATVEQLAGKIQKKPASGMKVLDLGAGYGGAARYLASTYGCEVYCLNISRVQNAKNERMTKEASLDHLVSIHYGSFEDIPFDENNFDIVWSQDSFVHGSNREKIIKEVARVLKPDGEFIFTDLMQTDKPAPQEIMEPILNRIKLKSICSIALYNRYAQNAGLDALSTEEHSDLMQQHYRTVCSELESKRGTLVKKISPVYLDNMTKGLGYWIDGAAKGYLTWGVIHMTKRM